MYSWRRPTSSLCSSTMTPTCTGAEIVIANQGARQGCVVRLPGAAEYHPPDLLDEDERQHAK